MSYSTQCWDRHYLKSLSLLVLLFSVAGLYSPDAFAQADFVGITLLNLDSEAGPLYGEVSLGTGQHFGTGPVQFGQTNDASTFFTPPMMGYDAWIEDTNKARYSGFSLPSNVTLVVPYGGGKVLSHSHTSGTDGYADVINVTKTPFAMAFRALNDTVVRQSVPAKEIIGYARKTKQSIHKSLTFLNLNDSSLWLLAGDKYSSQYLHMTTLGDTLTVGEIEGRKTLWGAKLYPEDSARIRVVNLTDESGLRLLIDGVELSTCAALSTAAPALSAIGTHQVQIVGSEGILFDSTLNIYPHLYTDLLIAPDGQNGYITLFMERVTNSVFARLQDLNPKMFPQWWRAARTVYVPTGVLENGRALFFDTTAMISDVAFKTQAKFFQGEFTHDNIELQDSSKSMLLRYSLPVDPDSLVYIIAEREGKAVIYTYEEFNDNPQSLVSSAGVAERGNVENTSLRIYPNPARGTFRVEVEGITSDVTLELTDVLGRNVKRIEGTGKGRIDLEIDCSGIAPGMYHLSFREENGKIRSSGHVVIE